MRYLWRVHARQNQLLIDAAKGLVNRTFVHFGWVGSLFVPEILRAGFSIPDDEELDS